MSPERNARLRPLPRRQRWIGLAEVRRLPANNFLHQSAAFVPVIGYVTNARELFELACQELATLQLAVVGVQDIELLSERRRKHQFPVRLEREIATLTPHRRMVFGTFYSFPDKSVTRKRRLGANTKRVHRKR